MSIEKFTIIDDQFVNEDRGDILVVLSDDKVYNQTTKHLTNIDVEWLRSEPEFFSPFGPEEGDPPDIDDLEVVKDTVEVPQISGKPPLTGLEDVLAEISDPPIPAEMISEILDSPVIEESVPESDMGYDEELPFIAVDNGKIIITGDDEEAMKKEMIAESTLTGKLVLYKRIGCLKTELKQEWED